MPIRPTFIPMSDTTYSDLRSYMRSTGATQTEIARALGVSQATISMILSGTRRPSLSLALKLARLASIPVESLMPEDVSDVA